jgi:hypothetical protein
VTTVPEHVDETGGPCAKHPAISPSSLYQLAMVGSRAPAFHHDCASKLQGLVMALDELTELTENGDPQVTRAIETALEASRELNALLNLNRALTRPVPKTMIAVADLVARGAERAGVSIQGALPAVSVNVGVAAMIHALALVIDIAAGTGRGRSLAISTSQSSGSVDERSEVAGGGAPDGRAGGAGVLPGSIDLALHMAPQQASNASEPLAIAGFVVSRDGGGRLWCSSSGDRIVIRLPVAPL